MRRHLASIVGGILGGMLVAGIAYAGRNSGGTYSLVAGNPVVSGSPISSTWANNTLGDLAQGVTDSLDRSGRGGMLADLRGIDGTLAAPSLSFTNETGTGLFRNTTNDLRLSVGGILRQAWAPAGFSEVAATTDGASAVGFQYDTTNSLANATAKLASWKNATTEKASLRFDGALTLSSSIATGGGTAATGAAAGDIQIQRSATPTTGNIVLGSAGTHFLLSDGTDYFLGTLGAANGLLRGVSDPTHAQDAATKNYVDGRFVVAGGLTGTPSGGSCGTLTQVGPVSASCSRVGTGLYTVTVAGLATTSIVLCSMNSSAAAAVNCTPGSGSFGVITFLSSSGASTDENFSFYVVKL